MQIGHKRGGLFSYIGELRVLVNNVEQIDYTDWLINARLEDHQGVVLPIITAEWVDILTGVIRIRIASADTLSLTVGHSYTAYILLTTPAGDTLEPLEFTLAMKRT